MPSDDNASLRFSSISIYGLYLSPLMLLLPQPSSSLILIISGGFPPHTLYKQAPYGPIVNNVESLFVFTLDAILNTIRRIYYIIFLVYYKERKKRIGFRTRIVFCLGLPAGSRRDEKKVLRVDVGRHDALQDTRRRVMHLTMKISAMQCIYATSVLPTITMYIVKYIIILSIIIIVMCTSVNSNFNL